MGSSLSVLDITSLGSSMSLRSFSRLGSSLSLVGASRLGASLSVLSFGHFGASLSVRNFLRLGSDLSINSLQQFSKVKLNDGGLYFEQADAAIYGKSGGSTSKRISFPEDSSGAGILHGVWSADQPVSLSDRRMKADIKPLHRTLFARMEEHQAKPGPTGDGVVQRTAAVNWVLRELRPVSFVFKKGVESKSITPRRYGFVAQEVERVLPDLVHDTGQTKYMIYQDLIAMITLVVQDLQVRLEQYHAEMHEIRGLVGGLASKFERVEELLLLQRGGLQAALV
jgi:hypothetical protein